MCKELAAMEANMDKCIGVNEVAGYLGIGRSLAWKLVWTGKIKSYKVGRLVRVRTAAVEDYLKSVERTGPKLKSIRQR